MSIEVESIPEESLARHRLGVIMTKEEHDLLVLSRKLAGESMNSLVRRGIRKVARELGIKVRNPL